MTRVQVADSHQLLEALDRKPVPQLALVSPVLETAEAMSWERRLNGLLDDCGCDAGTVGFLVGLAISLIAVLERQPFPMSPVAAAGIVLSTAVGAAVSGKLLGRSRSRQRARCEGLVLAGVLDARETAPISPAPGSSG